MNNNERQNDFWEKRLMEIGHTGWADQSIYVFDQKVRLKVIKKLINLVENKQTVLDFGCGVGDFSIMLAKSFKKVFAFDPIKPAIEKARSRNIYKNIVYFDSLENLVEGLRNETLDLIITVTVLDHILSVDELKNIIAMFATWLKPGGYLISLEYALESSHPYLNGHGYQAFRRYSEYKFLFTANGLFKENLYGFYNPEMQPCLSFKIYIKFARLLIKVSNQILNLWASLIVNLANDFLHKDNSGYFMKVMVYQKRISLYTDNRKDYE